MSGANTFCPDELGERKLITSRYLDHLQQRGCDLFRAVCARDLEGFVGKYADGISQSDGRTTSWGPITASLKGATSCSNSASLVRGTGISRL